MFTVIFFKEAKEVDHLIHSPILFFFSCKEWQEEEQAFSKSPVRGLWIYNSHAIFRPGQLATTQNLWILRSMNANK